MSPVRMWILMSVKVLGGMELLLPLAGWFSLTVLCLLNPTTRWDRVRPERGRHGSILRHVEEHGRADRGGRHPPAGAPGGGGQGAGLPRSETRW